VIRLTRLNKQQVILNADLIKFVENNPDTVITLVSGDKMLVHESADEVVSLVVAFRRAILEGLSNFGLGAGTIPVDRSVPHHERDTVESEAQARG
jgi:flagellar protein FlbD